ncbi:Protein BRANCHLESS TRICHOME like [Actinidia chinensis var. chinensis]|uniref:Protein BRANCHLESS TRICHOME like n=1 Tax=Actinidia chinensis var. chinensis TaxID=1590841 RepID=A0A2R6PT62_ACTCC|nr:Protein BRANCHLESS TRICHOME like [Actinidia chinensis var. chinensis]
MKLCEEVEEERKMFQMAEVWREERVQMKLVDAKVTLEEKYSQMNKIVEDLDTFLSSRSAMPDAGEMRIAEFLRKTAASVNIQEIKEFAYVPPKPNDIFSVFEGVNFGEANEREIEQSVGFSPTSHASNVHSVSPEYYVYNKDRLQRHSNAYLDQNGDIEDDGSGWEMVSLSEDQGSSYSPNGSDPSVNKIRRDSNVSGSGTEWEENACEKTPITEISEVSAVPKTRVKKVSPVSRLWRSSQKNGENGKIIPVKRLSNGRVSNGATVSPDIVSGTGILSPPDLVGQWSLPDVGNPHSTRRKKGCIERPRYMQKSSLKARLLEVRMESQKIQLHQVLNQNV